MSTKHVRTSADLVRFGIGLQVACGECGRSQSFAAWDVAKVFGTSSLARIRKRLRCSTCGANAAELTVLTEPPPR